MALVALEGRRTFQLGRVVELYEQLALNLTLSLGQFLDSVRDLGMFCLL